MSNMGTLNGMRWAGLDWGSPGGVKYRVPYGAKRYSVGTFLLGNVDTFSAE